MQSAPKNKTGQKKFSSGLLLFFVSISLLFAQDLNDHDLRSIYEGWLADPYPYMFDKRAGKSLRIAGKQLGLYKAGVNGILYYGGLAKSMAAYLDRRHTRFWSLKPLEKLSGHKIYIRRDGQGALVNHINPDIIRWGIKNLIPAPGTKIAGHSARDIYNVIFYRFFRLLAESYLYLHSKGIYKSEQKTYRMFLQAESEGYITFKGLKYQEQRFGSRLPAYKRAKDYVTFTPGMAFGFWLRRGMDKTHSILWAGLRKGLKLYDASWYQTLRHKYPQANVTW